MGSCFGPLAAPVRLKWSCMKMLRLAIISIPEKAATGVAMLPISSDGVDLRELFQKVESRKIRTVVVAISDVTGAVNLDEENLLVLPEDRIAKSHAIIEAFANLVSIANCCPRSISSPHPTVALLPESDEEKGFLSGSNGIKTKSISRIRSDCRFDLAAFDISSLNDRWDGVALLSEFQNHSHPTGKFHELMRLFERAFASAGAGLYKPLLHFLSSGALGFTKGEIKPWSVDIRHPVTHADRLDELYLEHHVLPHIPRMELAAYDVLLNKRQWHSVDSGRRDVWRAVSGPSGPGPDLFVTRGKALSLTFAAVDFLGAYYLDLGGVLTTHPANWYVRLDRQVQ